MSSQPLARQEYQETAFFFEARHGGHGYTVVNMWLQALSWMHSMRKAEDHVAVQIACVFAFINALQYGRNVCDSETKTMDI